MLIIDVKTEEKLLAQLKLPRGDAQGERLLLLSLGDKATDDTVEKIAAAAASTLRDKEATLYRCGDGDLFLWSNNLPLKTARAIEETLQKRYNLHLGPEHFVLYDLHSSLGRLLYQIENKLDVIAQREHRAHLSNVHAEQVHRRQEILNEVVDDALLNTIAQRRSKHEKPEVMIIEDDAFSRRLVENSLRQKCSLSALPNGHDVRLAYAIKAPHVVFLDINLPDVNGLDLLSNLISMDPQAYIIMLSGNGDRNNVMTAVNRGARGFVGKPFTREKLFQYIDRCPTLTPVNGAAP